MKVKELIEALKEVERETEIEIEFTYEDSDEGECSETYTNLHFDLTNVGQNKILTISEKK